MATKRHNALSIKIDADLTGPKRYLTKVERKVIPRAKALAFVVAGNHGLSHSSTKIAAGAKVPKWMIRGVGRKGKGGRLSRTKYIKSIDGIKLYLLSNDINPGGHKGKARKLKVTGKRPRKRKAGRGWTKDTTKVRATGRTWSKVWLRDSKHGPYQLIYQRGEDKIPTRVKIKLGAWAEQSFVNTCTRLVPKAFKKRFLYEYNRRLEGYGS